MKKKALSLAVGLALGSTAQAADKPNILIIFPDDVGWSNVSAYGNGIMGYMTPNIDRLAKEGILFTEHYAQPSSTAGRAALITGQYPIRSGMTTVGRPGAKLGLQKATPTLAEVLKEQGYRSGQFGKNHLGDRNEHLPTVHGFDEFFGNLYHLNTEEEPEQYDYPKAPDFKKKYGTRGVLHCFATDKKDNTEDPRFGIMGQQRCQDTGPLTRKRMETVDDEFMGAAKRFMKESKDADQPFFVWLNPSRMHMFTHLRPKHKYLAAQTSTEHNAYGSGMMEHDMQIGQLLDYMKELGVLDNTVIVYSTDNGPEHSAGLHGGTTPFRGEKMTTYEGGVRVPMLVRWPGQIPAGEVRTGIQSHMDIFTTLAAAAGVPDVANKMLKERKQPIDGVNNLDYWTGKAKESSRNSFIYYYESSIKAIRYKQWKMNFETSEHYYDNYTKQKFPVVFNLHLDPFESFDALPDRSAIVQRKQWINEPVQHLMKEHIQSLQDYPPVQKAATYDFSELIKSLEKSAQ